MSGMWSFIQRLYDHAFSDAAKAFGKWFGDWTKKKLSKKEIKSNIVPLKQLEQGDDAVLMIEDKNSESVQSHYFSDFTKMHDSNSEETSIKSYLQFKYG